MRVVAAIGFAYTMVGSIIDRGPVVWPLAALAFACAWAWYTHAINRRRILDAYQTLARIGDGDLAASTDIGTDDLSIRLSRGIARAQRGFAETLAHAELERDELRTLLGAIDNGIVSLDSHLRVRSANSVAERLLGLSSGQYRGRLLAEVLREPQLLSFIEGALASGAPVTAEVKVSSGSVESILIAAEPIRSAGGQPDGVLLAIDDLTRIRRLEKLRSDFAANVSHELRTPITNIKGYIETLSEVGFDDPTQARAFLDVIHRNAQRLSTLVEDTLLLAFLEQPASARRIEIVAADLAAVVGDAVEQLEGAARAKSMPIRVAVDAAIRIDCSPTLVSQAVLNLLSNAIKYADQGTPIDITARVSGEALELTVRDRGPGIDPIHLPRLFERFFRIDSARSRDLGGTGLGLAIVKHIMLVHGGGVEAHCPADGGTAFTMRFPRLSHRPHTN